MRLLHGNEMHFVRCPDGRVYSTGVAVYAWWSEYLRVFDDVVVAARVHESKEMYPADRLAEGPGVSFHDLPAFRGPEQFLRRMRAVKRALANAMDEADAYLFRVPGTIGYLGASELLRRGRPYGYEVVGDPYDVFTPGSVNHPLRQYFQKWHVRNLRQYCATACAASYVTEQALQRRYPPPANGFTTHFSDVGLKPECYISSARSVRPPVEPHQVLFVGTLEQLYKAPDVLIRAVAECRRGGLDVHLTMAGDGGMRTQLERLTGDLGIRDAVRFAGHVAGRDRLIQLLDASELFVLPSRAEGLPRAMLEAMARGVPCLGSTVNGIPELLTPEDLVPPNDVASLAEKMREVLSSPTRLTQMSEHGLAKAHEFEVEIMRSRKIAFLRYLRESSEHHRRVFVARRALTV